MGVYSTYFFICLCIFLGVASGITNVEGHTLFSAYEDVLPIGLANLVKDEAVMANKWTIDSSGNFMHGKRATFWLSTDSEVTPVPRNNIEKAILILRQFALPDIYAIRPKDVIVGAEWWVQVRSGTENIGFHYDKDEAMASLQSIMKHPLVSTVTYLSDIGSPTLIFNQTTDGNNETPDIPDLGFLSFPKFNRHITFSGDLQHGVLGSASKSGRIASGRVTLLINWWDVPPLEPNTIVLTDENLKDIGINKPPASYPSAEMEVDMYGDSVVQANTMNKRVDVPTLYPHAAGSKQHEVELPPGDRLFLNIPKTLDGGVHRVEWKWDEIYGNIGMLDLQARNQVSQLFRLPQPKVLFLYDSKGKAGKKLKEDMLEAILPFAKTYVGSAKIYFAPTSTAKQVLEAFALTEKDLPALVIDDTQAGLKHVQPAEDFAVTKEAVEAFIMKHIPLAGKENLYK